MISVALVGNPNTGKTSLFNALTRSYEYVGNWAGVTVEKKVGVLLDKRGELVDLPGVYSLSPLSKDEAVTTEYMLQSAPDVVLNVVDASQIERNLHLTLQLAEYGHPLVIALNMTDVAEGRGLKIDPARLSALLGATVVPVIARTEKGCVELLQEIVQPGAHPTPAKVDYGPLLEAAIAKLEARIPEQPRAGRWLALQFLEGNETVAEWLKTLFPAEWLERFYRTTESDIAAQTNCRGLPQYIRERRAERIKDILEACCQRTRTESSSLSEKLDALATHRWLGIPIFLLFMYLTFKLTFDWFGTPISDRLDALLSGPVSTGLARLLQQLGAADFIQAVVLNGIVAGVGGVLVFVPQIFMLFLIISFIEDSGYMARIATVMDKLMEGAGLNGKTFIPMIIGFGCNVPGIMAARTIEQPRERLLTILLTPLMSCSARLSVYSLFVGVFFQSHKAIIVFSLYVLGVVVALALAKLFSRTLARNEASMFVVELPPYRIPQWKTLARSTWEKGKGFVRKAGTFIFGGSVLIWLLSYTGIRGWNVPIDQSFMRAIGSGVAPILEPLGFGNWQAGAALITGFLAKEVVVSTMGIIYATSSEASLQQTLGLFFTPLQAYSFMVFILLYVPCLATVGVIRKETNSAKWTWFSVGYALIVAYLLALLIYRVGLLLGFH
ncbi:ferrous iron transport protein B [Cohnella nanjingensis]|uniref:Ferrous iron transport protein B n=1 Tax=Cohnella nanjingensis TaxID=1387779 RepID=A0A7X0VEV0_9BACL|nr:ferrous iron transport protein B [Cohnella nanjingensis]MBB6671395.1 ferrous iron transport protein B [Cohnella nanjingensis]